MSARRALHSRAWHSGGGQSFRVSRRAIVVLGLLLLVVAQSFLFYWLEKDANAELRSPLDTIWYIFIFLISGADAPITTAGGRVLAGLFILEGLVGTSILIASITAFRLKGNVRMDVGELRGHTIICGWNPRVKRLVQQFRSSDLHQQRPIVLLADLPQNPLPDVKDLIFIRGDASDDDDLIRAGIKRANSAIIMTGSDLEQSDGRAILIALAIESLSPDVYTCVEVYDPANVRHLQRAKADEIVCLSQFGEYLVLQSAISPGLSKMFMELLSFGVGDEVFRVPVSTAMLGKSFRKVMLSLATEQEIVAVAAERNGEIVVNPKGDYRLKEGDYLFVIAPKQPSWTAAGKAPARGYTGQS